MVTRTPGGATVPSVEGFVPTDVLFPAPRTLLGAQIRHGCVSFEEFVRRTGAAWACERAIRVRPRWTWPGRKPIKGRRR